MRKSVYIIFLFLGTVLNFMLLSSCRSEDNSTTNPTPIAENSVANVNGIVSSGTWKITNYNDSGTDKTSDYTGYNFTFGNNNVLTVTKPATATVTGTWSITDSNSSSDNLSDLDFNIIFMSPDIFVDISDDWDIIEKSNTVIKLKDVSGGNGGTDYLTFTKN